MPIQTGTHKLGPTNATLQVKTYRSGMAQKVGHDLIIEVTEWEGTVDVGSDWSLSLNADSSSLDIKEGVGGMKPLSDKDRADIKKSIDGKVLGGKPIAFSSSSAELNGGGTLNVSGDLEMGGATKPASFQLSVGDDGKLTGTATVTQSQWGIKPYSGLMGALKVKDEVEVVIDASLPAG